MTYAYRVFIEFSNSDTDAMHYSGERLYEGAVFRVNKPGTLNHGTPVIVRRVDSHPSEDAPGIAHAYAEGVGD